MQSNTNSINDLPLVNTGELSATSQQPSLRNTVLSGHRACAITRCLTRPLLSKFCDTINYESVAKYFSKQNTESRCVAVASRPSCLQQCTHRRIVTVPVADRTLAFQGTPSTFKQLEGTTLLGSSV
jgi:hypothetical protein